MDTWSLTTDAALNLSMSVIGSESGEAEKVLTKRMPVDLVMEDRFEAPTRHFTADRLHIFVLRSGHLY